MHTCDFDKLRKMLAQTKLKNKIDAYNENIIILGIVKHKFFP